VGWYAAVERLMSVSRDVFVPVPRVDSTVVRITRHRPVADEATAEVAFSLLERAYRQRRKMLRSSLGPSVSQDLFHRAGIEPTARPEELTPTDWARLATTVEAGRR
jgi:16S rRNA (adenine1518-N6/adenine1519-N6)-dimethyltransferase